MLHEPSEPLTRCILLPFTSQFLDEITVKSTSLCVHAVDKKSTAHKHIAKMVLNLIINHPPV
jgi:hypothetical protein